MKKKQKKGDVLAIQDLFLAGVHLGHDRQDWNPKMLPYIHSTQNGQHVLDLEKTLPLLRRATNFLTKVSEQNENIVFVGTKNSEIAQITKITAKITNQSYIATRWVHGMLSNWEAVSNSIHELNEFEKRLSYLQDTWPERKKKGKNPSISEVLSSSFSPSVRRRYKRLKYLFDGVRNLKNLPSVIVILDDLNHHKLIIDEARRKHIAIIGIVDSNSNPDDIHFPIPGNDDSLKSVHLYAKQLSKACIEGELNRIC